MTILVIAEHDNATLSDQTAKALSAALKMGGEVDILVAGNAARPAAEAAAKLTAVRKVLLAEAHELSERLAEPLAGLIVALAGSYDAIVAPATASGKNVLPRVAALLDVSQISEITEVISSDTFKRPIYAGNAIQTVRSTDAKKVITVRTASFQAAPERRLRANRDRAGSRRSGAFDLRGKQSFEQRPAGINVGQDHHLGWPRAWLGGKIPGSHGAGG